jgi:hypothetical protein
MCASVVVDGTLVAWLFCSVTQSEIDQIKGAARIRYVMGCGEFLPHRFKAYDGKDSVFPS